MKVDKRQKEYDKWLKVKNEADKRSEYARKRMQKLRQEMESNPIIVDERSDELILKDITSVGMLFVLNILR